MSIEIIVACGRSADGRLVIGSNGGLPWHVPGELKRFRAKTMGHTVVMGRKTYEGLPFKPLPGRTNIVLTSQHKYQAPGCEVISQRIPLLKKFIPSIEKCFIIGGAATYSAFLPWVTRIHFSLIDGTHEGDAFFPLTSEALQKWVMIMTEVQGGWKEITYGRFPAP